MFIVKRLRKGCNSTTMNFRDMGPFENPLVAHGNIGFNISGPPGLSPILEAIFLKPKLLCISVGSAIFIEQVPEGAGKGTHRNQSLAVCFQGSTMGLLFRC